MSNLHAYFALRNLQGFARALDGTRSQANTQTPGPPLSSSGGKSWTRASSFSTSHGIDVNARDALGRTVLHIACAVSEPFALPFVQLLLAHPNVNVNLQDIESRWSALHRALYAGNLAACILLLQRPDIDTQLKDYDGYSPFDVYNSTVQGTRPQVTSNEQGGPSADLFTWGANRNATLGHGDANDRAYPDQVVVPKPDVVDLASPSRFIPVHVKSISMAKLHTAVITDEKKGNLRACGFGSGGRLGPGQHTQYDLLHIPQFDHHVVAVALGQDHSLVVTSDGEVFSWGLNRFSQLGYVVEPPTSTGLLHTRAMEEPIQVVARKVVGPLKKEVVIGVAACKSASACWTRDEVFTWGTNSGQLGYDRVAQPVQVLPRKVTGVQEVTELALTDSAMLCLLNTMDVICFRSDNHFRIKFPMPEISDFPPYQHPHIIKPSIAKITSCDDVFAALSSRGDIFTFSVPLAAIDNPASKNDRGIIKPQRVWSLRKSFDPAKDVALGSDGELIVCTESGHVFVRSLHAKGGKSLKFHRVPFIYRAVRVCANSTGAFAALRVNYTPIAVSISGPSLADDFREIRPWMRFNAVGSHRITSISVEDDEDGGTLETDVTTVTRLCALLATEKQCQKNERRGLFRGTMRLAHGTDVFIQANLDIPAHLTILVARSPALRSLVEGTISVIQDGAVNIKYFKKGLNRPRFLFNGCQTMTVLLLLDYLYSDDVPALWDHRVGLPCADLLAQLKVNVSLVKAELEALAQALHLPALSIALSAIAKRVPRPTLNTDMERLFLDTVDLHPNIGARPDVIIELADRSVLCHSVILRARSMFFQCFFDDEDWTINRWRSDGTIEVDMKHIEWRAMSFVMAWIFHGKEDNLFENLDSVGSISDLLDLVFSVMGVASELLLDRLILLCSSIVLHHVTLNNVSSLLTEATYYNALSLIDSLQDYVASNMEAILESRLLDSVQADVIQSLTSFVQQRQTALSPVLRTNEIGNKALVVHADWLALQDVPQPIVRNQRPPRESPKFSPTSLDKGSRRLSDRVTSPLASPNPRASVQKPSPGDDIFSMEQEPTEAIPALNIGQPRVPSVEVMFSPSVWKSKQVQTPTRVDMKTIMAEAESAKNAIGSSVSTTVLPTNSETVNYGGSGSMRSHKSSQRERRRVQPQSSEDHTGPLQRVPSSDSPWKRPIQQPSRPAEPISTSTQGSQSSQSSYTPSNVEGSHGLSLDATAAKASTVQPATPASVLQASSHALGPVFSPVITGTSKRTPSDTAWNKVPAHEPTSSTLAGSSFAAIQQQQRDQGRRPKERRSLKEIQEEERAKQEEEDFLRWWAAEEEKLKVAAAAEAARTLSFDADAASQRGRGNQRRGKSGARGKRGGPKGGRSSSHVDGQ